MCRIVENIDTFVRMKKTWKTAQQQHGENVDDFSQDLKKVRNSLKMKINDHMISKGV